MNEFDTIVLLSNETWGDVWFSKQHYANELAVRGHKVYFINPPKKWRLSNLLNWKLKSSKITANLEAVDYRNLVPGGNLVSRRINDFFLCLRLKNFLKVENPLIWNFDPFRLSTLYLFKRTKYIYHVVDKYLFKSDIECASSADIIPLVTKEYRSRYSNWGNKLIHVPHGIPTHEFQLDKVKVDQIKREYGKYFLFVGTFHNGMDIELLSKISSRFSEINLVLVGPKSNGIDLEKLEKLNSRDNVTFVGAVPSREIKNYIAGSVACLIPYKMEQAYRAQTLKSLHYLAQQKPIVSIPLQDWDFLKDVAFFFGANHELFLEQLSRVLTLEKMNSSEVKDYLEAVKYELLIDKVFEKLKDV